MGEYMTIKIYNNKELLCSLVKKYRDMIEKENENMLNYFKNATFRNNSIKNFMFYRAEDCITHFIKTTDYAICSPMRNEDYNFSIIFVEENDIIKKIKIECTDYLCKPQIEYYDLYNKALI